MNPESDSQYHTPSEEGSGSGGSPMSPEWTDDEDVEREWPDQGSGSGEIPSITDLPGILPHLRSLSSIK